MTTHNYSDYQALILKLAHKWNRQSHGIMEFDELVAEGNLAFCVADQKFNPNKGVYFSSYLHKMVDSAMSKITCCKGYKLHFDDFQDGNSSYSTSQTTDPEKQTRFKEWLENLSKESQFLINLVFETPSEIIQWAQTETYNPKNSQRHLTRYLREQNWAWYDIWFCFREIKEALKEGI